MLTSSLSYCKNILLAEDDYDDCFLFKYALEELQLAVNLTTVYNGEELMKFLNKTSLQLPEILFLDINMPRKNGFECLSEIKSNERIKLLPVIIFTTCFSSGIADQLYKIGAHYYIRKPTHIVHFQKVIYQALTLTAGAGSVQPSIEQFVLAC